MRQLFAALADLTKPLHTRTKPKCGLDAVTVVSMRQVFAASAGLSKPIHNRTKPLRTQTKPLRTQTKPLGTAGAPAASHISKLKLYILIALTKPTA